MFALRLMLFWRVVSAEALVEISDASPHERVVTFEKRVAMLPVAVATLEFVVARLLFVVARFVLVVLICVCTLLVTPARKFSSERVVVATATFPDASEVRARDAVRLVVAIVLAPPVMAATARGVVK